MTIVTLLFLTPLFAPLPEAVLAALIIHAVWHIIASRKLQKLQQESRVEVWFGVLALAGVLLIDVLEGMIIGLVASLIFVVYKTSRPHIASLGRVPGVPGAYSDLNRHPENMPVPGVLIVRLDAQLYYANALTVRDRVKEMVAGMETPPRAVIFDASAQDEIDVTSTDMIKGLVKELHGKGIDVYIADVHAPVLEHGRKTGLLESIGEDHVFPTVDAAVRMLDSNTHDQIACIRLLFTANGERESEHKRRNLMAIKTYKDGTPFTGVIGRTTEESSPAWPEPPRPPEGAPNVLFFVLDDVGYGQLSSFGGLVETPVLDSLAANGLRYTNMHTTALCSPSRGCILTGRNHHSIGLASITETSTGYPGYNGILPFDRGMLSEMLLQKGYNTFCVGKWHLTPPEHTTPAGPYDRWPLGPRLRALLRLPGRRNQPVVSGADLRQPRGRAAQVSRRRATT